MNLLPPPALRRPDRGQTEAGLTLVELMIATVISGIAISAALAMGYSMMNGYGDHRRTSRVMRAARASLDIVANALRNASPAVPEGLIDVSIQDDDTCRGETPAVQVTNSASAPDEMTLIYAAGGVLTTLRAPFGPDDSSLQVVDNTGFRDNDLAMIVDLNTEEAALVRVNTAGGFSDELDFGSADGDTSNTSTTIGCALPATYGTTSLVIRVRAERFFVDDTTDVPRLSVDPFGTLPTEDTQPLALGIEDMQVAVGVDNGQGTATLDEVDGDLLHVGLAPDDDEWVYNYDSDTAPPNHDLNADPWRALRVTLTARSIDEPVSGAEAERPGAEDRLASATSDRYRRRQLRTTVELRNLAP